MNIYGQVLSVLEDQENKMFLGKDIKGLVTKAFGTNWKSILIKLKGL